MNVKPMLYWQRLPAACLKIALILPIFQVSHVNADAVDTAQEADATATTLGTVSVIGQGETRQVHRVTEQDTKAYAAGSNPMKVLQRLPGVNFQSSDPLGRELGSQRISLRGFDMHHLGYTLDGVTLGDMSFGNFNGLTINRAIIPENIASTEVAEGTGALGTASNSDLGGTLQFTSANPDQTPGLRLSQTLGSYDTTRTFLRADTGQYNGLAAYVAAENYDANAWKGDSPQRSNALNAKVTYDVDGHHLSFYHSRSEYKESTIPSLSKSQIDRLGYNWTNYAPDWQRAVNAANGKFSGGVTSVSDALYNSSNLRNDELDILSGTFTLSDALILDTTVYHHHDSGAGNSYYPFVYTSGSTTVPSNSIRSTFYGIDRTGFQSALSYYVGEHVVQAGVWIQSNKNSADRYLFDTTGTAPQSGIVEVTGLPRAATIQSQDYNDLTRQFYVRDTWTLLDDRLKLEYGAKHVVTHSTVKGSGTSASGSLQAKDNFLPQIGATYKLNEQDEIFASYAQNMAAFPSGTSSPLYTSQTTLNALNGFKGLKPETSKTVELGMRRSTPLYAASAALYGTRFDNRLLAIANCTGIVICQNGVANVGAVSSRGVELSLALTPDPNWRWSNTMTYNRSLYEDNYSSNGTVVAVKGKDVIDAPRWMLSSSLDWQWDRWNAGVQTNYMDKRYYTYTNDSSVDAYWVTNANMGYDFGRFGDLKDTTLSLNLVNLFDRRYISTINTDSSAATDPAGNLQILKVGSPRSAFVTLSTRL
ncbi:ligand-gated channel [Pseudomonas viridiflava]|uniref:TonB-dependent receptor family protein n=1 Tax=Pseudomonas viridiflava TaxID=33069 RepID=UPI0010C0E3ED|nr:TonB-dependent receptor [Pseudomonas viridiflava]TKJ56366.1 ligand-gated channel [Pseudomonas viridiflava]TKK25778.1 ligand-gated channel [Pseudomonas viridiflava]